jgi:hypothetical protein
MKSYLRKSAASGSDIQRIERYARIKQSPRLLRTLHSINRHALIENLLGGPRRIGVNYLNGSEAENEW